MNFNLVEMYNGLLRFNKHILNELAEGLKHLPNLDGVSKGDSLIINEQGNPAWGSAAFIPTFENAAYGIEWTKDDKEEVFSACIKPDDTRYLGGNKSSSVVAIKLQGRPRTEISYDKAVRVLRLGGSAHSSSQAGSGLFHSTWVRSDSGADVGFFTTVKLD
jgi:hypothetical protein